MMYKVGDADMLFAREQESVGQLASTKKRISFGLYAVQGGLMAVEYSIYLITFIILFLWKIGPEYGTSTVLFDFEWLTIPVLMDYGIFLALFLGTYMLMGYQKQLYTVRHERNISDEIIIIMKLLLLAFLLTLGVSFLLKNTLVYSRVLLMMFLMATFVEASLFRYIRKSVMYMLSKKAAYSPKVLIVGAGRIGEQLYKHYQKSTNRSYDVVGFVDQRNNDPRIIGDIYQLEQIIKRYRIDILYITIPSERQIINQILQKIYKYHIDIRIIPDLFDRMSSVYEYRQDFDYPCLQIVKTPLRGLNLVLKRTIDIVLSTVGLVVGIPLFVFIAAAIIIDSPGRVIFKQKRIGRNGIPFNMYKFRSMITDAEKIKKKLLKSNGANGHAFKLKEDPRVTRIGKFLRKYSLDELPQLWNVLKGEMSLIGPRPPLPEEVTRYSDYHWRRMDVRPGMTGLWQVSGRSDLTFEEWINLDIQYIERWSLTLELKIILKTIPVVIRGSGAY